MHVIVIFILCWLIFIVPYSLLIITLFMSFSYPVHLHDSIIVWSHDICTCTFPFILTHYLGVLTSWICIPDLWLFIADHVFEEDHRHIEEPRVFSIWLPVLLLNFYLCWFLILYIYHFQLSFHFLFIWYHMWTFMCTVAVRVDLS